MIKLKNLSKKYNSSYAIKDLSLTFNANETTAIIGSSGSGKTTLLRCISHLEEPTNGAIFINEKKLTIKNRRELCLKIGMVFQAFNLFPHMNVIDNLIYAPINVLKWDKHIASKNAMELLEKFGLHTKSLSKPADLSGGQKQRVAICRALMMKPEVMLFDEPTSALDPENIKDIIEIILLLKTEVTMIVVTHHLKFAKAIADRVIFMDHGLVLADQSKNDFFEKPKSHRAKLFLDNIGDLM